MPLLITLFYLLLPFQIALNPTDGIDLAGARIAAIFLGVAWFAISLKRRNLKLPGPFAAPLLLTFLLLCTLSLLSAENPSWGLRKLVFLLSFVPLLFIVSDYARRENFRYRLSAAIVFGAAVAALLGIVQFILQQFISLAGLMRLWTQFILPPFLGETFAQTVADYPSLLVNIGGHTLMRATAIFPDPHVFAFYLGMSLPLALGLAQLQPKYKRLFLSLAAIILLSDILTFSRGGYLGLVFGALFILSFRLRAWLALYWKRLLCIVFLVIASLLLPHNPIAERFLSSFNPKEGSNQGRILMWREALHQMSEHPLLGVGLGNYPLAVKPSANYREPIYAHNLSLDIAVETGIPNALLFLASLVLACTHLLSRSQKDPFFFWPAVSLVIFMAHALVETPLYSVHVLPLLLVLLAFSTSHSPPPYARS